MHIVARVVGQRKSLYMSQCGKNAWQQICRHGLNQTDHDKPEQYQQQKSISEAPSLNTKDNDTISALELVLLDSILAPIPTNLPSG